MHGIGDGEFKAQHDAALGKHIVGHICSGKAQTRPASLVMKWVKTREFGRNTGRIRRLVGVWIIRGPWARKVHRKADRALGRVSAEIGEMVPGPRAAERHDFHKVPPSVGRCG